MKIALIRAYDFPIGGAPQNRWLGILRGLLEQDCSVEVHVFTPAKLDIELNKKKYQIYKGIPIYNHGWKWSKKGNRFFQFLGVIVGYFRTILAIINSHKDVPFDWFFLNNNKNMYVFPVFLIAKILKVRLLRELNEFPNFVLNPSKYNPIFNFYLRKTNYIWFDAFIFMTKELKSYYQPLMKKSAKFLILPMTVDMDRFPNSVDNYGKSWNITYCGDLSQGKDGVLNLLHAFVMILDEFPESRLVLIGRNNNKEYMEKLNETVEELKLSKRITMTGYVHPDEIPARLFDSRLLVLCRPDSKQAQGGFPTKLGEYLATGVPVVVTAVGEIPLFLTNEFNAYIAEPGNVRNFADVMKKALANIIVARAVGLKGREIAQMHFSHSQQGITLMSFLSRFNKMES